MKTANSSCVVLCGLIVFSGVGCHKNTAAGQPETMQEGVARLRAALVSANPEVQSNLYNGVTYGIRYGDYARASAALQQIASDPSLNDNQKKLVDDVSNLLVKASAGQPDATQPAH